MTILILTLTLICLLMPLYVYLGYPAVLWLLNKVGFAKPHYQAEITPTVTLIISCYNEAAVLREKIKNSLALNYPVDKFYIIVISDGSDDGSDDIVREFIGYQIRLIRQEGRLGKTMGLNLALKALRTDITVFSDANAMYEPQAIRKLVQHFADSKVGYVVGAALYTDGKESAAAANEDLYWQYEMAIKCWESQLHSVVGGDGAIYAIRTELWEPLQQRDINDFVNPLQLVAKGYRGIFEPEARCFEETAGNFNKEAKRKERIVNRSLRGLFRVKQVLNPRHSGIFSYMVISHKLLRWLIPLFTALSLPGALILASNGVIVGQLLVVGMLLLLIPAFIGYLAQNQAKLPWLFSFPFYFVSVNYYALLGIISALQGKTQVTWHSVRPTAVRSDSDSANSLTFSGVLCYLIVIAASFTAMSWPYV
ncbi:glycosyltransferase family 2 protein [Alishewanella sp. HL-SH06]|uniref:glycosyltransferase family 2 protein n=1 Tax=Alishewanella sp. HL-SH06 TaxID=3461144 RepID=UPI0040430A7E